MLVSLRSFVVKQLLSRIYALPSVKFSGLKLWLCKNSDKYEVCALPLAANSNPQPASSMHACRRPSPFAEGAESTFSCLILIFLLSFASGADLNLPPSRSRQSYSSI